VEPHLEEGSAVGESARHGDIPHAMPQIFATLRDAGLRFSSAGCAFAAQAVAFNALFSLFPLVVLAISGVSLIIPHGQHRVLFFFDELAPALHQIVATNLSAYYYGRGITSIIALIILIWSGKNLFMSLAFALDRTLGIEERRPLAAHIAVAIVVLPLLGVALLVALILPILISVMIAFAQVPDRRDILHLAAYSISLMLVFGSSLLLYRLLPNRDVSWLSALPGAVLCAALWPLVQFAFTLYTLHINYAAIYGALAAPLVLLLWFYAICSIFLFGGALNAAVDEFRLESTP